MINGQLWMLVLVPIVMYCHDPNKILCLGFINRRIREIKNQKSVSITFMCAVTFLQLDNTIKVWDLRNKIQLQKIYQGFASRTGQKIKVIPWSPDGKIYC